MSSVTGEEFPLFLSNQGGGVWLVWEGTSPVFFPDTRPVNERVLKRCSIDIRVCFLKSIYIEIGPLSHLVQSKIDLHLTERPCLSIQGNQNLALSFGLSW